MFTVDDITLLESKEPKSRVSLGLQNQDEMPKAVFACKFLFRFERIRVRLPPFVAGERHFPFIRTHVGLSSGFAM